MTAPSANGTATQHVALKAGFLLKPPHFLGEATPGNALHMGALQQRLLLHFPDLAAPRMQPCVFCGNTKLILGQFQEQFGIPRGGSICATSWETLFRTRVKTSSFTLQPSPASVMKWVLLTSPSLAPLALPVTRANPLQIISWQASLPPVSVRIRRINPIGVWMRIGTTRWMVST